MVHTDNMVKSSVPLDEDTIIERIGTNITDGDIRRYFGDGVEGQILKYSDLANYNTIDELLPKPRDFRIILIEDSVNKGHWCCILKYDNTIEWFNPYGIRPDAQKNLLGKVRNIMLGQERDYMTELMEKSKGYKLIYNKKKLQKLKEGINTCGRWIILRVICMKDMLMDLKDFIKMVSDTKKKSGLPNDAMVAIWIG
jgi:hypothetical protein